MERHGCNGTLAHCVVGLGGDGGVFVRRPRIDRTGQNRGGVGGMRGGDGGHDLGLAAISV